MRSLIPLCALIAVAAARAHGPSRLDNFSHLRKRQDPPSSSVSSAAPVASANIGPGCTSTDPCTTWTKIDQCPFPNVPLATDIRPYNKMGEPEQDPSLALWAYLNMEEWLKQSVVVCPDLLDPYLIANVPWPFIFFRYLVSADAMATCKSDSECTWDGINPGDAIDTRGNITSSSYHPPLSLNPSDAEILVYRRWYGAQSVRQMRFYYASLKTVMDAAFGHVSTSLPDWTSWLFDTKAPPAPEHEFGLEDMLGFVKAIAVFIPQTEILTSVISEIDVAQVLADTFVKSDPKAAAVNAKDAASQLATALAGKALTTGDRIKDAVGGITESALQLGTADKGADGHKASFADFGAVSDAFDTVATAITDNFSDVWDKAVLGDPMAPGGYFDAIQAGAFAGFDNEVKSQDPTLRGNMQEFLKRHILQYLLRSTGFFILKDNWEFRPDCIVKSLVQSLDDECLCADNLGFGRDPAWQWANQMCLHNADKSDAHDAISPYTARNTGIYRTADDYRKMNLFPDGFVSYTPLTADLQIGSLTSQKWQNLNDDVLVNKFKFPSWKQIALESVLCMDAHNQDFYAAKTDTPTTWSEPDASELNIFTANQPMDYARAPTCTWNIPVWDVDANANRCTDDCHLYSIDRWNDAHANDRPGAVMFTAAKFLYP